MESVWSPATYTDDHPGCNKTLKDSFHAASQQEIFAVMWMRICGQTGTFRSLHRNTSSTACPVFLRTYVLWSHFYFYHSAIWLFSLFLCLFQCNNSIQRFWQSLPALHAVTGSVCFVPSSCTFCTFSLFCTPQCAHSVHLVTEEDSRCYSHHCLTFLQPAAVNRPHRTDMQQVSMLSRT